MGIYFLGIDGGGTKTELVLTDSKRNPLRTLRVEGCNPMDIGMEECKKILRKAIRQICEGIPYSSVAMFAGIAGGGTPEKRNLLSEFFKEFQFCCYANDSDNLSIIAAGLGKKDGVILIMGTGICALLQVALALICTLNIHIKHLQKPFGKCMANTTNILLYGIGMAVA